MEGTIQRDASAVPDAVAPVHAYRHDEVGPAVIGGCVYRGAAIPGLVGAYLFGDLTGQLFAIGAGDQVAALGASATGPMTAIAFGPDGEPYVLTHNGGAFRLVPG